MPAVLRPEIVAPAKVGLDVVAMFWIVLTAPELTLKLVELKEAIPLVVVVASSMVMVEPEAVALATLKAPDSVFRLVTPEPAAAQPPKKRLPEPSTFRQSLLEPVALGSRSEKLELGLVDGASSETELAPAALLKAMAPAEVEAVPKTNELPPWIANVLETVTAPVEEILSLPVLLVSRVSAVASLVPMVTGPFWPLFRMSPVPPTPAQLPLVRQKVPLASGSVQVLAAVRSALVMVPLKRVAPPVVIPSRIWSSVTVALLTVTPAMVAPPFSETAVEVAAPLAVTVARVSASEVKPQLPHWIVVADEVRH